MVRKKVTVSLSSRCLQLIDHYSETTGFESRSRVIEESIFAISELLGYREIYARDYSRIFPDPDKKYSADQVMKFLVKLSGLLARFGGILDRFVRFENIAQKQASEKIYRKVPVQEREKGE